jgi:L-ascorbate metabolism protein UlaG (beta-lactamase superfamily)
VYISGDTVWFGALKEIPRRFRIGTALVHLGGVRFSISGPARYTLDAPGAVSLVKAIEPRTIVPIHYDGWTHFAEPLSAIEDALRTGGFGDRLCRLPKGVPTEVEV